MEGERRANVLMVQGTSSSVGKSVLVTGLCRVFARRGIAVAPFKAQNMSNNAAVTDDGLEIGRAQAVQAHAAGLRPHVDMNPVLIKPESDRRAQLVLLGRASGSLTTDDYRRDIAERWQVITAALDRLRQRHDLVVIEGAGSPAEINLRDTDLANMRLAQHAGAAVLLVGDIDRGGVFAHLYGTIALLADNERRLIRGLIVNRFRGERQLLDSGLRQIEQLTGVPVLGVVPWISDLEIPEEDAVAIEDRHDASGRHAGIDVAIVRLPRIANFDEFDSLERDPGVRVRYVDGHDNFGDPDLGIVPGTKSTLADLAWLRTQGIDTEIAEALKRGAGVVGICGGYQMLGSSLADPEAIDGPLLRADGLALLPSTTTFAPDKVTRNGDAIVAADRGLLAGLCGTHVQGYEIHAGRTEVEADVAFRGPRNTSLGVLDETGWILGCYLHGIFENDDVRHRVLSNIAARRRRAYLATMQAPAAAAYDRLADVLEACLDIEQIQAFNV